MLRTDSPTRLDALSEMLALSSFGNTKNVLVTAAEIRGPLDVEAMAEAGRLALRSSPEFCCCIRELREGPRYKLYRRKSAHQGDSIIISDVGARRPGQSSFDRLVAHLRPRLDRDWDLFHEAPAELHILRFGDRHHMAAFVMHHVAADAGAASDVGRKIFEIYHSIRTGTPPDWACLSLGISTHRKRPVRVIPSSWRDVLVNARDAVAQMVDKPVLPTGSGDPSDQRQHQVKRLLSTEETEALINQVTAKGVSFIDMMVASTNIAIDRWNQARGIAPGLLTTSMSVNMRGRYQGKGTTNNSGLIFFRSSPEQRSDEAAFARSLALARIKQFRKQKDHKFYRDVQLLNAALRPLPFRMKRRVTNYVMSKHQYSVAITLLGVVWPGAKNGRPSQETCVGQIGEATITELHGIGYKLLSNTHLVFIIYIFQNRLNFVLAASASHFTREEAESFMDLVLHQLLEKELSRPRRA